MENYETTFEIESETDAYAIERLMERVYDSLREETRTLRAETVNSPSMLEQFRTIRDASRATTSGRLTVVYEQRDGEFAG